jgi:tRNA-specific 2-thiouridylase
MSGTKERVVVAMSGGVDSSVSAYLLLKEGFDCLGVTMRLYMCPDEGTRRCCSVKDREDAKEVANRLQIGHVVVDGTEVFKEKVIRIFVEDYLQGLTPSPCVLCNQYVKAKILMEQAKNFGAKFIATGHYARVVRNRGDAILCRAKDKHKDQSYFLFLLGTNVVERLLLPVGDYTKERVREIAKDIGLPVSEKPDSQEICFVPKEGYVSLIEQVAPDSIHGAGDFVDMEGRRLGTHRGIHAYTVGQRKGLGIARGFRQYVVSIRPDRNEVVLGDEKSLLRTTFRVQKVSFLCGECAKAFERGETFTRLVQIRSRHRAKPARITKIRDEVAEVKFLEPQTAIAPGQAAVFYDGERVCGGGFIARDGL